MAFASILDSLGDVTSVLAGAAAFAALFVLLKGFERV
jgi:hypothetical protein